MPKRCARRLQITPDILADDVRLGEAIDQVLLADPGLNRIHRQLIRRQRALRALVTDEQWRKYMLVEEAFTDYHARAVSIVARAFYSAGHQAKGRRK